MKVNSENIKVERSGNFKEKSFTIRACPKAFSILSSGIYSDIKLAIVRELSTNAHDAMIAAGTQNKPFDVHLPNSFDPHFSIRDYGTGLSQEDIEELYTTYFASNKTDSNDYTGCLGIGSKSPFSYTDNFTVISYFGGKKYTYSAFRAESGFPQIALMGVKDTDEPNGMEITIAINRDDFVDFKNKARLVYRDFDVRPNISGAEVEWASLPEPILSGDDWSIYATQQYYAGMNHPPRAIMGQIGYPLKDHMNFAYDSAEKDIFECHVEMKFNLGELEIAASREELQYSELTKRSIRAKIEKIRSEIVQIVNNQIDKEETLWDGRLKNKELFGGNYHSSLSRLQTLFASQYKWRGRSAEFVIKKADLPSFDPKATSMTLPIQSFYLTQNRGGTVCRRDQDVKGIVVDDKLQFVIDDLPKGATARVRNYLRQNEVENVQNKTNIYLIGDPKLKSKHQIEKFFADLGMDMKGKHKDRILYASKLPKPTRIYNPNPTRKLSKQLVKVERFDKNSGWYIEEVQRNDVKDYPYVILRGGKVYSTVALANQGGGRYGGCDQRAFDEAIKKFEAAFQLPEVEYCGIKAGYFEGVEKKAKKVQPLFPILIESIKSVIDNDPTFAHQMRANQASGDFNTNFWRSFQQEYAKSQIKDDIIDSVCDILTSSKNLNRTKLNALRTIARAVDFDVSKYLNANDPMSTQAEKINKQLDKAYPLIRYISINSYFSDPNVFKECVNYIALCKNN